MHVRISVDIEQLTDSNVNNFWLTCKINILIHQRNDTIPPKRTREGEK